MTNPAVICILFLIFVSGNAKLKQKNSQGLFSDDDPTRPDDVQETKRFEGQARKTTPLKLINNFEQLLKSLNSDYIPHSDTFHDLLLQELNGTPISKELSNHLDVDEIFRGLQDFLSDVKTKEVKNTGTEHQQKMDSKYIKFFKDLKKDQQYLQPVNLTKSFNPSENLVLPKKIVSLLTDAEPLLDHRTSRSTAKDKHLQESTQQTDQFFYDSFLNVTSLAARHGYKAEEYTVQTKDGYILGLHRIWTQSSPKGKRRPVLLMHGLLLNSAGWLSTGPDTGMAYLLARDGHDVWLGNVRGNHYSRAHISLNPESSSYWQFCSDEIGMYDLPAIIDKVLNETGAEKLDYVGFSQGGGVYFIMCSELPHYCEKANIMIGIAPSGRHLHTKSPLFRLISEFCQIYEKELFEAGVYEMLPKNGIMQKFFNVFCRKSDVTFRLCELVLGLLDSQHPGSLTKKSVFSLLSNFPSGTSVHNLARYGQMLKSRTIRKFDYGREKNLQLYGSTKPPQYNLSNVKVPTVVIYGRNDGIVDIDDVKWLIQNLPNVIEAFEVEDRLWTHMDVVYSQYAPRLLYPKVKKYLTKL